MARLLFVILLSYVYCNVRENQPGIMAEDLSWNQDSLVLASRLITTSSMKHVMIIEEDATDHNHDFMRSITEPAAISVAFTTVSTFAPTAKTKMESLLVRQHNNVYWNQLNFIVVCGLGCITRVIEKQEESNNNCSTECCTKPASTDWYWHTKDDNSIVTAHRLDREVGRRSLLRHFSRWILVPNDGSTENMISVSGVLLDHVNIIIKTTQQLNNSIAIANNGTCLFSLLWGSPGVRTWTSISHALIDDNMAFPNRQYGLNGRTLYVAVLEYLPYLRRKVVDGSFIYTGMARELLDRLSMVHNFSFQYVEPEDKQWGDKENQTWTGIVGMLQRLEADMCGVPYAVNIERVNVMTYSWPIVYFAHSAVYKKTVDEWKHWVVLTSCFRWEVYLFGAITSLSVCVIYFFIERFNPRTTRCQNVPPKAVSCLDVANIAMIGITAPLHQGNTAVPQATGSKILLSFWWLFCIVITSVYTGNLIAFLTVSKEYVPFTSLEQVGQQQEYEVGVPSGGFLEITLKTSNNSLLKSLWIAIKRSRLASKTFQNATLEWQDHMDRLSAGGYVFMMDKPSIDVLRAERCDLSQLTDTFMPIPASFTFPRLSPLSELFSQEIMRLGENGLIQTWYKLRLPKSKCSRPVIRRDKIQLKLKDLLSAVVACAVGILLSVAILGYEIGAKNTIYKLGEIMFRTSDK